MQFVPQRSVLHTGLLYFAASLAHPLREWLDVLSKWICSIDHSIMVELMDKEAG